MSRKLLLNSLSGTVSYAVYVIVVFIMSPIYIHALGNRDYGLWELIMSIIGYMGLLDLGIGGTLVRFVSVADARQDKDDLQQTISTAFAFFVSVGILAVLLFFMLGYSPGVIAGKEAKDIANLSSVFLLLGVNAGMLFPMQVFVTTLMGIQQHYIINIVRMVLLVVNAGLSYYLLLKYQGRGLLIMALLEPIFTTIQFIVFASVFYLNKSIPKILLSAATRSKAKEMLIFGVKSMTMMVASRLQNQTVPLIISHVLGLGQIVYFVIPNRLVDYSKGLSRAIGFPLTPFFGSAIGRGDHQEVVNSWLKTTLALQIVSMAMPIGIFFCGETFLSLWIGLEYAVAGRIVLYILLAGLVADALATNAFTILTAQGKHGSCAMVWFVLSVLSVPLGIWGAHLWGVAGVAAGTTMVTVLANIISLSMACTVMKIPLITFFRRTLLRVTFPLILFITSLWIMTIILAAKSYGSLFMQISVSGAIYLMAIWGFTLEKETKKEILNYLFKSLIKKFKTKEDK